MFTNYVENPKLAGTNIIDCIPHIGECPLKCPECFYNGGRFFRTIYEPWMPPMELVGNRIVRVNSGHDSNVDRKLVLEVTRKYKHKFYNTTVANFDFPAPIVFTCNGGNRVKLKLVGNPPDNLMFVRVRVDSWDMKTIDRVVGHYWKQCRVPVVLTFMRYYNGDLIPDEAKDAYEWRKNIINSYYCAKVETVLAILARYKGEGVRMCGTPVSSSCLDCRNCEFLYWDCLRRMNK